MTDDLDTRLSELLAAATKGPWEWTCFTKPDGAPILSIEDVAAALAHSARQSEVAELWGVTLSPAEDNLVVCYTGNGARSKAHAEIIAQIPQLLADRKAAKIDIEMMRSHGEARDARIEELEAKFGRLLKFELLAKWTADREDSFVEALADARAALQGTKP